MLAGGGIGAITGAMVGGLVGRPGAGAALGAGVGAMTGGAVGSGIEESERRQSARLAAAAAAQPAAPPLSLSDVVQLTRSGSSDVVIINQIRSSGSIYHLSANDIMYLQNEGVREPVVREMQQTAYRAPRRVIVEPATVVEPVYVAPAPAVVGVSYGWGRRW
jgi:hypothetical protein